MPQPRQFLSLRKQAINDARNLEAAELLVRAGKFDQNAELCRRLLPALLEGASTHDDRVARLALDVLIHAVVEHMGAAA